MIDSYKFGSITVDGKKYTRDLIIFPDRIKADWRRKNGHMLDLDDIRDVLDYEPDIFIIGTGAIGLMKVDSRVTDKLRYLGIKYSAIMTARAVKEYNRTGKDKRVVFAAHLTC